MRKTLITTKGPFTHNLNAMNKVIADFEAKYGGDFNRMPIMEMKEIITAYEWERWCTAFQKGIDIGEPS